ncbi:MAG: glycosyltransferase, partial [Alphaproteobacteria bacterium]
MTKFSLILNVCNSRQDLPSLLNSLLKQTEKDFEVLVFDNASDDGSLAIMKLYADKDKRIKLKNYAEPHPIAK